MNVSSISSSATSFKLPLNSWFATISNDNIFEGFLYTLFLIDDYLKEIKQIMACSYLHYLSIHGNPILKVQRHRYLSCSGLVNVKDIPEEHFPSGDHQHQHKICRNIHFLVGQVFVSHNRHYEKTQSWNLSKMHFKWATIVTNLLFVLFDTWFRYNTLCLDTCCQCQKYKEETIEHIWLFLY